MVQGTWSAGDDRFGKISVGKNDNEEVYTNLDEVPANVEGILYVVSVFNLISTRIIARSRLSERLETPMCV